MARTMVYSCDICKQNKDTKDLAKIKVTSDGIHMKDSQYGLLIDICKDCLQKKGFVVEIPSDEDPQKISIQNKVNMEDKIRDILADVGVVFQE